MPDAGTTSYGTGGSYIASDATVRRMKKYIVYDTELEAIGNYSALINVAVGIGCSGGAALWGALWVRDFKQASLWFLLVLACAGFGWWARGLRSSLITTVKSQTETIQTVGS